jgi:hypothetical protein
MNHLGSIGRQPSKIVIFAIQNPHHPVAPLSKDHPMFKHARSRIAPAVPALVFTMLLSACGDSKPVAGDTYEVSLATLSVPLPEKRQIPLDILNARGSIDADAFASRLKADGFSVTVQSHRGKEFEGKTANRINKVVISDYVTIEIKAKRDKSGQDSGIGEEIRATFENGALKKGSWRAATWFRPPNQGSVIPNADPVMMEIKESGINHILAVYALSPLKGEKAQGGLGVTKTFRRDDSDSKCYKPDGSPSSVPLCKESIQVSYQASYQLTDNRDVTCWNGACQIEFSYFDDGLKSYNGALYAALGKVYQEKFGEIDPPK